MNDNLSGAESLAIIEQMIKKAKNQFSEDGSLYLLWGWVILLCSLGHFVLDQFNLYDRPWDIWGVTWVVALYMLVYLRKKERKKVVRTYTEELLGKVWFAFVIMMVVSFTIVMRYIPEFYKYNFQFVLLCYGMPTFLSGFFLRFRPLVWGGVACWVLAVTAGEVNYHYHPLFVAVAVVLAWIVPGYILKARAQSQLI
jgi:hypothetical protein